MNIKVVKLLLFQLSQAADAYYFIRQIQNILFTNKKLFLYFYYDLARYLHRLLWDLKFIFDLERNKWNFAVCCLWPLFFLKYIPNDFYLNDHVKHF